tara:strand:- start:189 stop:461 length:273 start_codon:yes stop_codon:yes gene_type:complete
MKKFGEIFMWKAIIRKDYSAWIKENFNSLGDGKYQCKTCLEYGNDETVELKDLDKHVEDDIDAYSDDKPEHMSADDLNEHYSGRPLGYED